MAVAKLGTSWNGAVSVLVVAVIAIKVLRGDGGSVAELSQGRVVHHGVADPDKDGNTNLEEFAFGLNPTLADIQRTALKRLEDRLEVSWVSRVDGVAYEVEVSADLTEWHPVDGEVMAVPSGDGLQDIHFRAEVSSEDYYLRLNVSLEP